MAKTTVRFTKPVILGTDSYAVGDVASLDAGLAAIAITGRVAVEVPAEIRKAVAPAAPERAVAPAGRKAK